MPRRRSGFERIFGFVLGGPKKDQGLKEKALTLALDDRALESSFPPETSLGIDPEIVKPETVRVTIDRESEPVEVEIKDLPDIQEIVLDHKVITKDDERCIEERLPDINIHGSRNREQLIWLTKNAIEERMDVLVQTDPRFMIKPSTRVERSIGETSRALGAGMTMQKNIREHISHQSCVKLFEEMGFRFVRNGDGEVVMLVDATISERDNTSGRVTATSDYIEIHQPGNKVDRYQPVFSKDNNKLGFKPATRESVRVIEIPLSDVLRINKDAGDLGSFSIFPDRPKSSSYGEAPGKAHARMRFKNWLRRMLPDGEGSVYSNIFQNAKTLEGNKMMFRWLQDKGFEVFPSNGGYYPYEPQYRVHNNMNPESDQPFAHIDHDQEPWINYSYFSLVEIMEMIEFLHYNR